MFEIKNVMTKAVVTVTKHTLIGEAIKIMVEKDITGLPVVDDNMKLVGMVTEKDVLMLLYGIGDRPGMVEDFMTTEVVTFDQEDSLVDVCNCLLKNHFRRVAIVAGPKKKLVGIISRTDIIKCVSRYQGFFRDTPYYPDQLAKAKAEIGLMTQK
ncbi:MAG: CBS domain-containing protein [Planctomycetota bacterium]|jgi:CBS domain-containing protein